MDEAHDLMAVRRKEVRNDLLRADVLASTEPRIFESFIIEEVKQSLLDQEIASVRAEVGPRGLDSDGSPLPAEASTVIWEITKGGKIESRPVAPPKRARTATLGVGEWQAASAADYTSGDSPRYATLDGPETLSACGAAQGYGWYRIRLRSTVGGKRRWHLPQAADRVHLFLDGVIRRIVGVGRGADHRPFELQLAKGQHTIVGLVDNLGRFAGGNDLGERKGLFGHIYRVKRLAPARPVKAEAAAVDPFALRGYIEGRTLGQLSDTKQVMWSFTHARKLPIIVEVDGAEASGTFVLNDKPVTYYAGATGGCLAHLLLDPRSTEGFRRGKNVLRFAPDPRQPTAVDRIAKTVTLYECIDVPSDGASWAFAKWEPPPTTSYEAVSRTASRELKGTPCWWRTTFVAADPVSSLWMDTTGLSKGQAFVNRYNLGRYFTATADGRAVGPQRRLYVPASCVKPEQENELLLFDEHGFAPHRTRLDRAGESGE